MHSLPDDVLQRFQACKVLVVDDEHYSRKVARTLLMAIGITEIYEAVDGESGLEAVSAVRPDAVLVDWDMPGMDGAQFVRRVRAPQRFPFPEVPIVMLSAHSEKWRVVEALRLGVHEYLLKPVSMRALCERMISVIVHPRPIVRRGDYYGPQPRTLFTDPADGARAPVRVLSPATPPAGERQDNRTALVG